MDAGIQKPFLFNALKHHSGYNNSFIKECQTFGIEDASLNNYLLKMGNCMLDLYYGHLEITHILSDIEIKLRKAGNYLPESFKKYISCSSKDFQNIQISDHSTWTLLIGNEAERYIHIHPARGSIHTIRIRAIALKTALIMKMFYADQLGQQDLVGLTNEIRSKYLGESPIKNITYTRGIRRALKYL